MTSSGLVLRQNIMDHLAVVNLQPFATGDFELAVIESQQVQNGRMQVSDVVTFAESMIAEFVGGSMDVAFFQTGSRHPDRESVGMMIATICAASTAFQARRATEFCAEDDQSFVEQSALFQILQ